MFIFISIIELCAIGFLVGVILRQYGAIRCLKSQVNSFTEYFKSNENQVLKKKCDRYHNETRALNNKILSLKQEIDNLNSKLSSYDTSKV